MLESQNHFLQSLVEYVLLHHSRLRNTMNPLEQRDCIALAGESAGKSLLCLIEPSLLVLN